jgi:altronate hydrolase
MNESTFIKINPADNVVVCLRPFQKGETIDVDGKTITLLQDTPAGHKVLTADVPEGSNIINMVIPSGMPSPTLRPAHG